MSTMHAAVLCGDGRIEVRRAPLPQPAPDEVCIRLEGCGVCTASLPLWAGQPWFHYPLPPGAPGREGWGEVAAVGAEVEEFSRGDRVAMLSAKAFAEYDVARADDVVALPAQLDGLPLPGEPLACAMNILQRSAIEDGQRVAVVGIGFIGALLVQLAANAGAEVIAVSRRGCALAMARDCGAAHTIALRDTRDAIGAALELTHGAGCTRVIEAAGEQASLDIASAITAESGRLIIAGYHQGGPRQVDMQQWNARGIDVINAHQRDPAAAAYGLREAVAAVAAGRLDPLPLLTHLYPLDRIDNAFAAMRERADGFMKATVAL